MAIKVTGLITPNSGSYIAEALHIVFAPEGGTATSVLAALESILSDLNTIQQSGGTVGDASTIIYSGQQTIKQKIEALESGLGTAADHITYSYTVDNDGTEETVTTNVKAMLDTIRAAVAGLGDIDNKVTAAQTAATQAALSASTAQVAQMTMTTTVNEKITQMTEMNNQITSKVDSANTRIDNLSRIANDLKSVFEADGLFVVLSNAEYRQLAAENQLSETTIYLCYDEEPTGASIYTLTLSVDPSHSTRGSVVGHGDYNQGVTVIAVALPRTGYKFDHWSDDNTDNPRYITMDLNREYIAYFDTVTSSELPNE